MDVQTNPDPSMVKVSNIGTVRPARGPQERSIVLFCNYTGRHGQFSEQKAENFQCPGNCHTCVLRPTQ